MTYKRPTWDEYFIEVMDAISKRATCDRGRSGCVIVKDKRIISAGYVGAPVGLPHCDTAGHLMRDVIDEDGKQSKHCVRTVHAEQNAIVHAAKYGVSTNGATLYCRMTPCRVCTMLIINAGIKRVVCEKHYQKAKDAADMFKQADVELIHMSDEVEDYSN